MSLSILRRLFVAVVFFSGFTFFVGCLPPVTEVPVNYEKGTKNYFSPSVKQETPTKYAIAIMDSNCGSKVVYSTVDPSFCSALDSAIGEILNKKGFAIKGPYKSIKDMTYIDKSGSYLALTVDHELALSTVVTDTSIHYVYTTKTGTYTLGGKISLQFVEPLTGEVALAKSVTVPISKRDFIEQLTSDLGVVERMVTKGDFNEPLTDTTGKAYTEVYNEIYAKAVEGLIKTISREELLSLEKELLKLKERKAYN
jgi:hypothetical protein